MNPTLVSKFAVGAVVVVLLLVGVWDVYLALTRIQGETPSDIILQFLQRYPVIAVLIGVLIGHLVWPQYR